MTDRRPSIKAAPAEACPNCGNWYAMGECRHASHGKVGTLYGVCSFCADRHEQFSAIIERTITRVASHGERGPKDEV